MFYRQDYDQCARRNLQLGLGVKDPDYYEFEGIVDIATLLNRLSVNKKRVIGSDTFLN